jgi:hypothetical protein
VHLTPAEQQKVNQAASKVLGSGAKSPAPNPTQQAGQSDVASDQVALRVYHRYLTGVVADIPSWLRLDDGFIASVSATCPNVLAALNLLPVSKVNMSAVIAFGEEAAADINLAALVAERPRFASLATALSKLRWSSAQTARTIRRYS